MRLYPQLQALPLVGAACGSSTGFSLSGGGEGNMPAPPPSGSASPSKISPFPCRRDREGRDHGKMDQQWPIRAYRHGQHRYVG